MWLKLRAEWVLTAEQREQALAKRHTAGEEFRSRASKEKGERSSCVHGHGADAEGTYQGQVGNLWHCGGCPGAQLLPGEDGQVWETQQAKAFIPEAIDST